MEKMRSREHGEELSPEDVLRRVAEYSRPYADVYPHDFSDGTFGHGGKLYIDVDRNVVLVRFVNSEPELVAQGLPATPEQMQSAAFENAYGTPALSTSADIENWKLSRPLYGVFKIPVDEFIELAKQHRLILGNAYEREVVLSGDVGKKYLAETYEKDELTGEFRKRTER